MGLHALTQCRLGQAASLHPVLHLLAFAPKRKPTTRNNQTVTKMQRFLYADLDGGLSTPTKKPCTGSPARSPEGSPPRQLQEQQQAEEEGSQFAAACTAGATRAAGPGRAGGRGSKGKLFGSEKGEDLVQADTQPRPHAGAVGKGAQKQKQLTSIPEFSRRTKAAVGMEQGGKGKAVGRGRGGQEVGKTPVTVVVAAGAVGTRSSRRLAAKAEALAIAAATEAVGGV